MAAEDFFNRWAKRKPASSPDAGVTSDATADSAIKAGPRLPADNRATIKQMPTLEDAAGLTRDSDYSPFVARGVDEEVKRVAMKKLFSDPHFNIMDGLDIYIGDYNKFEPIPPEMLAVLNHAKALLDPLGQFGKPLMHLVEESRKSEQPPAENSGPAVSDGQPAEQDSPAPVIADTVASMPADSQTAVCDDREAEPSPSAATTQNDPASMRR